MHEAFACYRVAGIPRKIAFLDRRSCSQLKHGQGGGKATKGDNCDRAGLAELRQTLIRIRMAEAQRQVRRSQMVLEMWSTR